ncbi:ATP-dependent zinc metalloprotease FtsH [Corynebacterium glutamicum]|uniref:ATP-dependent zinc metalloprotease FtsH n=1 Tax=Corynebacterium glutamicum TaxID=1718 RepID=UPI00117D53EB|nr:ATP-dependent zinc metalloprotease FtsH [Corynebacterium glutamicum]QDQ21806.1 ATP-dependent zinc metalloprotease FtsH [Corynebacterium glutamicum]QDQ22845.1 ATP-dependent zinc metalloprotease FtsH [Corynebacterium glutamicum]
MKNKKYLQFGGIAAVILIVLFLVSLFSSDTRNFQEVDTSVAMAQLDAGNVAEAQIDDREQRVRLTLREPITVDEREGVEEILAQYPARTAPAIFEKVEAANTDSYTTNVTQESFLMSMLSFILPMVIIFGLLMFFLTRMQGGGMFGIGGSKAKQLTKDMPTNTFADVAGAEEAVDELHEIKDFLEDPTRYEALGAKIPRGVLLYGPPGTGKTLLARAVAGEAGVPFYSISGSDFVEMFVGVGASRVRDLFKQAKENSPCIIFVDEIDAVGRARGSGMGGGHDEREQTLNQLLVEMDGFGDRQGVILMAATNRPDVLDPALLRPGRFDRQIPVTNPDLRGREQILEVHAKGKPFAPDADIKALAKRTAGMSGADLANVLNEAALLTARVGGNVITADALEEATDRVVGGPRRSGKVISEKEKKVTAYHEGGHTLSAWALEDIERVYKVTILARGRTGGHAMTAQEDDKGMYNRNELFARLVFAMGGRSAEELVFGEPTTGASADIEMATKIARSMVTEYGMSPAVGMVKYGQEQGDPFSGRGGGGNLDHSQEVAATIDTEVQFLLDKAHEVSYSILAEYRDHLDRLAEKLLEKETLRRPDLEALFDDIVPRKVAEVFPDESTRFPRQENREPVKTPVELALERGEEPPKKFSILEASRATRERRRKELEAQGKLPVQPASSAGVAPAAGAAAGSYGTPPPADWSVPGSAGKHRSRAEEQPAEQGFPAQTPAQAPEQSPDSSGGRPNPYATPTASGEHPGMKAYGFGDSELMDQSTGAEHTPGNVSQESPTEMIGFRLPDHERSDYPEKAQKESVLDASETTEMPVVPDQPIDGDSGKSAEGTQENPENEGDNRG